MKKILALFLIVVAQSWGIIDQLDTENADRNITSIITVLTDTPSASNPMLCQGLIYLGDGTKNLDGSGGNFELTITVGGQTIQPSPQVITFGTEVRSSVWTTQFSVPANAEVILRVKSPNGADTDVDVTAYLYDVFSVNVIEDAVWDAALTGVSHNDGTSAGKRLRQVEHTTVLRQEEQAQGGSASTITLHTDASTITGFYDDVQVVIVGDMGIGQSRHIHAYVGSTRVASITPDWITNPDNTSDYVLMADSEKHVHEIDTDAINAASTSSDYLAEINAEVDSALAAINLDHLVKSAVDTNLQTTVHDDSVIGYILATTNVSNYSRINNSLQNLWSILDSQEDNLDAILTDTNELQIDWTDGGRLDLIIDVIKARWDELTTIAGLLEVIHGNI